MKVKIKSWEKMVEEFGLEQYDSGCEIPCEAIFTDEMDGLLPEDRIIDRDVEAKWYYTPTDCFWISDDMIEEYL